MNYYQLKIYFKPASGDWDEKEMKVKAINPESAKARALTLLYKIYQEELDIDSITCVPTYGSGVA